MIRILSSYRIFEPKKSELFREFDTWSVFRAEIKEKLNGSNFELSQDPHAYAIMWQISFDDFLSSLRVPPVHSHFPTKKQPPVFEFTFMFSITSNIFQQNISVFFIFSTQSFVDLQIIQPIQSLVFGL